MKVNKERLLMAFDLLKQNPELESSGLLELVEEKEGKEEVPKDVDRGDEEGKEDGRRKTRRKVDAPKARTRWTEDEDRQLINLIQLGLYMNVIADKLGRSERSVQSRKGILRRDGKLERG